AVNFGVHGFDIVEDIADFRWRELGVIEESYELVEGAFEVDVVFPERVVRVDDQVLRSHRRSLGARRKGTSKTASISTGSPARLAGEKCHLASASSAVASRRESRCFRSSTESTEPSLRMTAVRRTMPWIPSRTASALYLGSTLRMGSGGLRA